MDIWTSLLYTCLASIAIISVIKLYVKKYFYCCYNYWNRRNIPCVEAECMYSCVKDFVLLKTSFAETLDYLYKQLEGHKLGGIFKLDRHSILLRDPDVIRQVTVTHFHHFHERGYHTDEANEPLSSNLYTLRGSRWHRLRTDSNGPFNYDKVRSNFHDIKEVTLVFKNFLLEYCKTRDDIVFSDLCSGYTADVVGLFAFGLRLNALTDKNSILYRIGREVFGPTYKNSVRRLVAILVPGVRQVLRFTRNYKLEETFVGLIKATIEHRKKRHAFRDDYLQKLVRLRNVSTSAEQKMNVQNFLRQVNSEDSDTDKPIYMSLNLIASQCFGSFLFGMEPTAVTITFSLYEMALNPDIQKKVRQEVDHVLSNSEKREITFEAITKMKYLNQVVSETLRKYPPMPYMERVCTKTFNVIGTDYVIEKDTRVLIPIYALQHDECYYEKPDDFDPERFSEENKKKRHTSTFLPFGEGLRNCIGQEYSLIVIKTALAMLISTFVFDVCSQTQVPIILHPRTFLLAPKDGVCLKIKRR